MEWSVVSWLSKEGELTQIIMEGSTAAMRTSDARCRCCAKLRWWCNRATVSATRRPGSPLRTFTLIYPLRATRSWREHAEQGAKRNCHLSIRVGFWPVLSKGNINYWAKCEHAHFKIEVLATQGTFKSIIALFM